MQTELTISSPDAIGETATEFLRKTKQYHIFAFYGSMGAGKTTFIKALCKELEVTDQVSSPTFALIYEYKTSSQESVYHFDFYRINKLEEVYDMGYEDYFYSGNLCFIEWPEKIEELLPDNALKVFIEVQPDGSRRIAF